MSAPNRVFDCSYSSRSDEPIINYIPELKYKTQELSDADQKDQQITFRMLMSHMAGLGREHPDGDATDHWPEELGPNLPPGLNGLPFPNVSDLLRGVAKRHLIMSPYKFPSYSNTGFGILGAAIHASAKKIENDKAPESYAALIKRDIFDKIGMKDSSFLADNSNRDHIVVPSVHSEEVVSRC